MRFDKHYLTLKEGIQKEYVRWVNENVKCGNWANERKTQFSKPICFLFEIVYNI